MKHSLLTVVLSGGFFSKTKPKWRARECKDDTIITFHVSSCAVKRYLDWSDTRPYEALVVSATIYLYTYKEQSGPLLHTFPTDVFCSVTVSIQQTVCF